MLLLVYTNPVFADYVTFSLASGSRGMVSESSRQITKENEVKGISVSGMLQIHPAVFSQNLSYGSPTLSREAPCCLREAMQKQLILASADMTSRTRGFHLLQV